MSTCRTSGISTYNFDPREARSLDDLRPLRTAAEIDDGYELDS